MKNIKELLSAQYSDATIDGFELKFKKLTWNELKEFEKMAKKLQVSTEDLKDAEQADETEGTKDFFAYLTRKFVLGSDLEAICEESQVGDLPFAFCVKVINGFVEETQGEMPSVEEAKKK